MINAKTMTVFLTALICGGSANELCAQVAVIVNKANPIIDIELRELHDIYLGDMVSWPDNKKIFAVTQRSENEVSRIFYEIAIGKKIDMVKRLWIKISLSGQAAPPKTLVTDEEVLEYVAANAGAIGFVDFKSVSREVKVVKVDGKEPLASTYMLKR